MAAVFAVALGRTSGAMASPKQSAPPSSAPAEAPGTWYGARVLLADGSALLFTIASASIATGDVVPNLLFGLGSTGFLLGGPIVHWTEGRVGRGFLSLGMRTGLPIASLALGATVSNGDSFERLGTGFVAFVLAIPAAIAIDASVLAWRQRPSNPSQFSASSKRQKGLFVMPMWDAKSATAGVRVAGSF